ncbi:pectin lyase-like protein [Penicillium waksmanii]|uniref:pectin lyase-like protein n=1 Tax=Penicillium waksmanii TaxID=69791 RepID=UPI002548D795|nr:pectin lyase-like protein [Penicillium waksmanii]KAJ6000123.1 pectin lyase-like protein [Penicillium waksmanii]
MPSLQCRTCQASHTNSTLKSNRSDSDCQENMVEADCSEVHIYGLGAKAAVNMITSSAGKSMDPEKPNTSNFCSTIALFEQSV